MAILANHEISKLKGIAYKAKGKGAVGAVKPSARGKQIGAGYKRQGMTTYVKKKEQQKKGLQFAYNVQKVRTEAAKTALKKLKPAKTYESSYPISAAYSGYRNQSNTAKTAITNVPKNNKNTSAKQVNNDDTLELYRQLSADNNALNIAMNRENNLFNAKQAELARGWEEQMSNTAHQREVADLQAAGLNPILSAGGTGASTPVASNASASNWTGADTSFIKALSELASAAISSNAVVTAAGLNSAAVERSAAMQSNASMYGADRSAYASMYGSDQSRAASMYAADQLLAGTRYSSDNSYRGTKYSSDKGYKGQLYSAGIYTAGNLLGDILGFAFPTKYMSFLK